MCYQGKCFLCIPIERGSLVCAIIIAIVSGLSMLISIILGSLTASGVIFCLRQQTSSYSRNGNFGYNYEYVPNGGAAAGFFILAVTSICGLVFAVLLCLGIIRRRPGYVKAYFIYGVIVTALAALISVILLLVGFQVLSVLMIISCTIYSLFLVLVQKSYFSMLESGNNGTVLKQNELIDS